MKMSPVPHARPPSDLPAALREIDRLRALQEKNASSAMVATRRAFDEQARLEKKIETLERAAEEAKAKVEEATVKAEREAQDTKKALKAAKKKTQKLEAKLEEQKMETRKWEKYASENLRGEMAESAEKLERASQREIELEDRCSRQESALEAMRGQIEELSSTLEDERKRVQTKTSSQANEVKRLQEELREALDSAATIKEEADLTVESLRAAMEAQVGGGDGNERMNEEIQRLRARVEELSASQVSSTSSDEFARLEEKTIALERLLEGERASKAVLRAEKDEVERCAAAAEASATARDAKTAQLDEQVATLSHQVVNLEQALRKEQELHASSKKKAIDDVRAVRNTSTAAEKAIAAANAAMDSAETRAEQSEQMAREREESIKQLTTQLADAQRREDQLRLELSKSSDSDSQQLKEKQQRIEELSTRVAELETVSKQVDDLKEALRSATAATTAAARSIEESEVELAQERQRAGVAEEKFARARQAAEEALKSVQERDARIKELTLELQSTSAQVKEARDNMQLISASASSNEENEKRREVEVQAATSLAKASESRAAGLASQLKIAEDAREEAAKDVDRLKRELSTALNSLKASKSAATRAVQEAVSASGKRAQQLTKELETAKQEHASARSVVTDLEVENKRIKNQYAELEILVAQLRESLQTIERDAETKNHDKLDMEYMRREEDLRAEISDLVLELHEVRDDSMSKIETAERQVSALESQIEELEAALIQSRDETRTLSQQSSAKRSDLTQETSELRKKLVEAQEIAATASGATEAVKRRYEARLRDASELAEKQIISLTKDLDNAKRLVELAEKAKAHAQQEAARAADDLKEKDALFEEQLANVRMAVNAVNDEKLALSQQVEEAKAECAAIRKQKDAMENDLVETCSLLEKVSAKANASADEYKITITEMNASTESLKEKLEAEILLAMDLAEEKEIIIRKMETRQDELRAQLDALHEKSSVSTSRVVALESKLKETTAGERERLVVLQTENKRLEKRLKDTWTALQGAHAVVEQTKTAAKDAVRKANTAASRAEKVALKLKQELASARGSRHPLVAVDEGSEPASQSASQTALRPTSTKASPVKPIVRGSNNAFDDEMQRASDLLERISRQTSRESSLKDDESTRGGSETSSQAGALGGSFGYRGAMQ